MTLTSLTTIPTFEELEAAATVNLLEIGQHIARFQGKENVSTKHLEEDVALIIRTHWELLNEHEGYDIFSVLMNFADKEFCELHTEVYDAEQERMRDMRFYFIGDQVAHEDSDMDQEDEEYLY